MTNPCRRHFQRVTAALAAAATAPEQTMEGATQYELQLAQLHQDRQRLSAIQSREGKGKLKAELLPAYEPYVAGVLEAGQGAQDEVLTTVMIWRFEPSLLDAPKNGHHNLLGAAMSQPLTTAHTLGRSFSE
ncbi:MAG: hypothetical protein E2581_22145 [Pseudomonas sp.]|nr:hypothetical protein [Pseudomonas sp.]